MKTAILEAEVTAEGIIHLDVPVNLPPGKVEIVLDIQPQKQGTKQAMPSKEKQNERKAIFGEVERLLRLGLSNVTWEEIKAERQDDENRY